MATSAVTAKAAMMKGFIEDMAGSVEEAIVG
jgi:hypothetical protein